VVAALLATPDKATCAGRRDHMMIVLAVQIGFRISALSGLTCGDVTFGSVLHGSCHGNGRKQRITSLARAAVALLPT
jgi:site-specific recombinase XerD